MDKYDLYDLCWYMSRLNGRTRLSVLARLLSDGIIQDTQFESVAEIIRNRDRSSGPIQSDWVGYEDGETLKRSREYAEASRSKKKTNSEMTDEEWRAHATKKLQLGNIDL